MLKWQQGRLGTGYRKLLLAQWKFFDLWLIDYPPGANTPYHTDPVPGKRHFRANLTLCGDVRAFRRLRFNLPPVSGARLNIFRPDVDVHKVLASHRRRIVLSLGVAI